MDSFTIWTTIISLALSIFSIILTIVIAINTNKIQKRDSFISNVEKMCIDCMLVISNELTKLENELPLLNDVALSDKMISIYNKLYFYVKLNTKEKHKKMRDYITNDFQSMLISFYNTFNECASIYKKDEKGRKIFYQKISDSITNIKIKLGEVYEK